MIQFLTQLIHQFSKFNNEICLVLWILFDTKWLPYLSVDSVSKNILFSRVLHFEMSSLIVFADSCVAQCSSGVTFMTGRVSIWNILLSNSNHSRKQKLAIYTHTLGFINVFQYVYCQFKRP